MMFSVVLSLCLASSLAAPSIGYSYSAYAPLSYSSYSYSPYHSLITPLKSSYAYATPTVYSAPAPVAPLVAPVISAPAVAVEATGLKTQYHTQDGFGQASYGHSEPHQSHSAVQDAHGNKIGSFSYVKPDGQVHRTDYVADAEGYRVASNDLPVGPAAAPTPVVSAVPAIPAIPAHDTPVIVESPTVPAETPEVIAAKAAHFAAHARAAHGIYKRSIYPYATPVVTPSGHLADTPEVAAAKAAHFAEHAKQGNYYPTPYYSSGYYGPYAAPVVTPSGYLADTPEVAAAKAAHFAEKAKVAPHYNAIPYAPYTPHGGVPETPEVVAAKAAHFAEHAKAAARNAAASHVAPAYSYAPYAYSPSYYATPVVTPSGYLADTPEVAHAKAAHLAEHAAVASRQKRSIVYGQTPASTVPLTTYAAPVYPYAHSYSYAAPVSYPYASVYSAFPYLKPATHTTVVHGPHAVSYQVA